MAKQKRKMKPVDVGRAEDDMSAKPGKGRVNTKKAPAKTPYKGGGGGSGVRG